MARSELNAVLNSGCPVSPAPPCPCVSLCWSIRGRCKASTFLSVPIYSCMHRKGDKGWPLRTGGERRKTRDSSEKSVTQGGCSSPQEWG